MIERLRRILFSRLLLLLSSVLCTLLALWLMVRNLNANEVIGAIGKMPAWPFALGFCGLILGTVVRGLRFHILMRRNGSGLLASLETIVIGYFFTTLLPLRAGELVRIGYFARRAHVSVPATTAAVVVERVMDMAALAFMASIFLPDMIGRRFKDLPLPAWALGLAAFAAAAGALCLGTIARRRTVDNKVGHMGRIAETLDKAMDGLSALGSVRDAFLVMALSIALWCVVTCSIKFAFRAIQMDLPFADAAVIMLGTCFAIALPSTPGFVGTYHMGFVAGAALVGIPGEIALPIGIVFHLVIQMPFLPIGGALLFTGGRKILARPPSATGAMPSGTSLRGA